MVDPRATRKWLYRGLYASLAAAILFFQLLPLSIEGGRIPAPDLLVALTFAWVLRRRRQVPALLVGAVFLTADLLLMRPPGLWAALVVVAAEMLRRREPLLRDTAFVAEWLTVAVVLAAITAAERLVLVLTLADGPAVVLTLTQYLVTVAAYPLVVLFCRHLIGVRKVAPGEVATREAEA